MNFKWMSYGWTFQLHSDLVLLTVCLAYLWLWISVHHSVLNIYLIVLRFLGSLALQFDEKSCCASWYGLLCLVLSLNFANEWYVLISFLLHLDQNLYFWFLLCVVEKKSCLRKPVWCNLSISNIMKGCPSLIVLTGSL